MMWTRRPRATARKDRLVSGRRHRALAILLVLGAAAACDQDPFGQAHRRVAGQYQLYRSDEGLETFYLATDSMLHAGGNLHDEVLRIGWSPNVIVAKVRRGGPLEEWLLIDAKAGWIQSGLDSAGIVQRPEAAGLTIVRADSAWSRLRR
jgi:hypothetical protein